MLNLIPFSTRQFAGTKRSQATKTVLYGQLSSLWPHCVANAGIIFLSCFFLLFFFFPHLILTIADWMSTIQDANNRQKFAI